jgi:riboflavin transporter
VRTSAQVAILGAIAFVCMYFDFPLPFFPPFLKYDPSEVPALIATFAIGPAAGVAVEVLKALLIQMLRSGTVGGPFGVFMNLLAGVAMVAIAGRYYLVEHTKRGAVKALLFGVLAMTGVMIAANVLLTPIFFGIPRDQVVALVLPALLPFNLLKGLMSSAATFYVYKRVRVYLYEWIGDRTSW